MCENLASNICMLCLIDRAYGIKIPEKGGRIEGSLMNEKAGRNSRLLMNEVSRRLCYLNKHSGVCKHGTITGQGLKVRN